MNTSAHAAYERIKLRYRFKDILTLSLFAIGVAVISLVVMNILVFPVALLAVTHKGVFNFIITDLAGLAILILIAVALAMKAIRMKREGLGASQIAAIMIRRPFRYLAIFFFFAGISALVIILLYFLFSIDYYLLYRIMNR